MRRLPLTAGALGITAVLANRLISGVRLLIELYRRSMHVFIFMIQQYILLQNQSMHRHSMQIEPTLLASSSQSRSDVIVIFISAVLALTGLQWLSLKPKTPVVVDLHGEFVEYFDESLSDAARSELLGYVTHV